MKQDYPTPYIVEAIEGVTHTHTCILLHGLGSNGRKFGEALLASKDSSGRILQQIFPFMKFIFPTAKKQRSTIFKRSIINQWFDIYSFEDRFDRNYLQAPGLRDTAIYIHSLVAAETKGVPLENIVLGGLSQGYAASIHALSTFDTRLGAFIGMSGWFPFVKEVDKVLSGELENEEEDNIFGYSDDEADGDKIVPNKKNENKELEDKGENEKRHRVEAINFMRENIEFAKVIPSDDQLPILNTPVFLGHGEADDKISLAMASDAKDAIAKLGFNVTWKAYPEFGHWYKEPDEIDDIIIFLSNCLRFQI